MLKIPSLSVEYLKIPISGASDLATFPVEMAVVPDGQDPDSDDWKTAEWSTGGEAMVLIGPGTTLPLTKGVTYVAWARLTLAPETPVLTSGKVHIT